MRPARLPAIRSPSAEARIARRSGARRLWARIAVAGTGIVLLTGPGAAAEDPDAPPQILSAPAISESEPESAAATGAVAPGRQSDRGEDHPSNVTPPEVSGTPREGETLTASQGEWEGTPPLTFVVQWQRCNARARACHAIPGAGAQRYALSAADVGATLRVVVRASNGNGTSGPARSAPTGVVSRAAAVGQTPAPAPAPAPAARPSPPVMLRRPVIVGEAEVGRTLTSSPGRWQARGPIELRRRWMRCRPRNGGCSTIPGATGARYRVRRLDEGSRLKLRVTAVTAGGTSTAESVPTGVVHRPRPALIRPFPIVHIKGFATASGATLELLSVTAPRGARITVRCLGDDCPFRRRTTRARGSLRFRALEQGFRVGTRFEIRVTKPGLVGKYTSIVIRANRAPARRDRCLTVGSRRPVRCPAR